MSKGHSRRVEARQRRRSAARRRRVEQPGTPRPVPADQLAELARRHREQQAGTAGSVGTSA